MEILEVQIGTLFGQLFILFDFAIVVLNNHWFFRSIGMMPGHGSEYPEACIRHGQATCTTTATIPRCGLFVAAATWLVLLAVCPGEAGVQPPSPPTTCDVWGCTCIGLSNTYNAWPYHWGSAASNKKVQRW